ncbi:MULTISPECIES: FprA family A-type flavoprotein [unclassified Oceanispirochaeta]|uniref:FprA family A-type flavoprotein n=1 Tax=unclassified Oceanispirochaeta TaxID=2635722 RepID=UPI000E09CE95|nr:MULTISPECIES: FprA family A-type flavoprotein [unclassified Oceanispirochaeta]MBF9016216.1 FprA family A-type flavoprotein [Oceanispirochaeta sp. M2]NPD72678.1 FprA family A-type flavoprotein [Oceanispirochaeta sp. M1]RDG31828.1 FprA family A-type flavoprotein [Oceanispirochaeta sp. M1]
MKSVEISKDVYRLGVNIEPGNLFEGIWAIPDGTSINSYIVKGDKTAVIDLTQDKDDFPGSLSSQMKGIGVSPENIDYIIVNHMEPDHTGWLGEFRKQNPEMMIYCSKKAVPLVEQFCGITENVHAVEDGEILDLGQGKTLQFFETPNIHWPETIMTYLQEDKILFACDAFGSYGKVDDSAVFDDQLSDDQHEFFEKEALRYYANIVASFSVFVERGLKKLEGLDIKMICPSHGIIWRENPSVIVERYARYASYLKGPACPEITVIWGSMYGNTAKLVTEVIKGIRSEKVPVHQYRVPEDDIGFILADAWRSAGIVLGMPTYEYQMFPPMAHVIDDFNRKKVQNKKAFRFGSFGWSGGAEKELGIATEKLKWEFLESVEWQGAPGEEELKKAYQRGKELAVLVKEFAGKGCD